MNRLVLHLIPLTLVGSINLSAIDPTFQLKNKSNGTIQVNITQAGRSLFTLKPTHLRPLAKGKELAFQLDTSKPTALEIYYCPTAEFCKTQSPEKLIARFTENKTMYIKFNGKKIEPQKGNPITNKSTSGFTMKNNVTIKDISTIKAKPESVKLSSEEMAQMIPAESPKTTKESSSFKQTPAVSSTITPPATTSTTLVSVPRKKSQKTADIPMQQVGKIKPELVAPELQTQEAVTLPAETTSKTASQLVMKPETQQAVEMPLSLVAKQAPEPFSVEQRTQPATRVAPTAPSSKKQAQKSASETEQKVAPMESVTQEKKSITETQVIKPDSKELAWQEFTEANLLRKKLKHGDDSPFVARKVLGLSVGASEADIKKGASKLESYYKSRSYNGDISLVPDIVAIITHAKQILIDAIYPSLSANTSSPFRQELLALFYQAPDGFEDFAAPVYQDLIHTSQYSRDFLQDIQKKTMAKKGLPEKWRQSVLSKLQRELSRIK